MRTDLIDFRTNISPTIYDWSLLNREYSDIVRGVFDKWQRLVVSDEREPQFQQFLSEYAGMFFGGDGTTFAISQFQLGSERRPDFVVIHDGRSAGLHYQFIELKRPCHSPCNKNGSPSQYLHKARDQIMKWKQWLEDHSDSVKKLLPSKHAVYRSCSFTIFIGRRENSIECLNERNYFGIENRVHVHSYDYLADELAKKLFRSSQRPMWASHDDHTFNQLANPFVRAFTHKSWHKLIQRLGQSSEELDRYDRNFLTCGSEEVVKSLKHNGLFDEFLRRQQSKTEA